MINSHPCRTVTTCVPQGARHVAKDLAGKNQSNPTATLLSTSMLLRYLRLHSFSDRLEKAVLKVWAGGEWGVGIAVHVQAAWVQAAGHHHPPN
jgi:isocitrate/isopropylmalate dehydrogenase